MADKQTSLQDLFLNALRRSKTPVTMFLVKGVKLQGIVTWFDNFSVLLRRDGQSQLIYKHAISTIMPSATVDVAAIVNAVGEAQKKAPLLQEIFLNAVRKSDDNVTMFLVNGVMLQYVNPVLKGSIELQSIYEMALFLLLLVPSLVIANIAIAWACEGPITSLRRFSQRLADRLMVAIFLLVPAWTGASVAERNLSLPRSKAP